MKKELKITLPKGYMNTAVTRDNYFIADTNDSANWDKLKFPLPAGDWKISSVVGKVVMLINVRRTFWTKWF